MAPTSTQRYKKILKGIGDDLTFGDVGSLKFICRGKIGAAALDKVPNREPLKLFKLLEERMIITQDNLTWLREILKQIQRMDLVNKIPDDLCKQSTSGDVVDSGQMLSGSQSSGMMVPPDLVSPYRALLKAVADELTTDNVNEMKFLLDVPDGISERLVDGQNLLTHLEGCGKLSENNFDDLKSLLDDVYRRDLIRKIEDWSIDEVRPSPQFVSPIRDPDSCYTMKEPYGFALIINIEQFEGETEEGYKLNERRGSKKDLENLENLWEKLGFIVEKHRNLKGHGICTVVEDMVKKIDKNESSCFVCCIMTHGTMDKIYGSDCKFVNIGHITDRFKESNCPALAGKPKLFFLQACRGREMLTGRGPLARNANSPNSTPQSGINPSSHEEQAEPTTPNESTPGLDADAFPATNEEQNVDNNDSTFRRSADPNEANFLLGYSTAAGYASIRSIEHGTWYINALVKIFGHYYREEDVMQMMVRVNGMVNGAFSSQGYKQCPTPVFTLSKSLYFLPTP